jgi:hypothetical protein
MGVAVRPVSLVALVALVCMGGAGCRAASSPPVAPAVALPAVPESDPARADHRDIALVWTVGHDGERETWTVDAGDGMLSRAPGVRIAAGKRVWTWHEAPQWVATTACPRYDASGNELPPGPPPAPGHALRATLERDGDEGGADVEEVVAPVEADGAEEVEQGAELVASVGPYLFVRVPTYAYACGLHGNTGYDFLVWDVESRAAAWASSAPKPAGFAADWPDVVPRAEALRALGADPDVAPFGAGDGGMEADVTEVIPAFDHDAQLTVEFQLTAPACYACSDGAWSSYTKSTRQPAIAVPAALRAWSAPPAAVALFARSHPELTLGGWSRLGGGSQPR